MANRSSGIKNRSSEWRLVGRSNKPLVYEIIDHDWPSFIMASTKANPLNDGAAKLAVIVHYLKCNCWESEIREQSNPAYLQKRMNQNLPLDRLQKHLTFELEMF